MLWCFITHFSFQINEQPDYNKMPFLLIDYLKILPWDFSHLNEPHQLQSLDLLIFFPNQQTVAALSRYPNHYYLIPNPKYQQHEDNKTIDIRGKEPKLFFRLHYVSFLINLLFTIVYKDLLLPFLPLVYSRYNKFIYLLQNLAKKKP